MNVMAKFVRFCTQRPQLNAGIPAITEIVSGSRKRLNLVLTATDYLSVVFSAPGRDGKLDTSPRVILKYIVAQSRSYKCAKTDRMKHLPKGYAPEKESLWTPAKSAGRNHWIDPAFGEDLDRAAQFLLAYDPGDYGSGSIQVYRCAPPPDHVWDFIMILKAHTHGLFDAKHPETLQAMWGLLETAILRNNNVESMMWSKIPDAKFGFKMKNIFEMASWKRKNVLEASCYGRVGRHHRSPAKIGSPGHRLRPFKNRGL